MTVPVMTTDQLIAYLKEHGWDAVSNEFWNDYNRVIIEKDNHTVPIQIKERYFFPHVVKLCERLGIPAPPDHQQCYDQYQARKVAERKELKNEEEE